MPVLRALSLAAVLGLAFLAAPGILADDLTVGKDYYELRRFTDALASLKLALQANPQNWEAYYYSGLIYQENGKPDLALKFFASAWRAQPGNEKVGQLLSETYLSMAAKARATDGLEGAIGALEAAMKAGFFSAELLNQLMACQSEKQKWETTIRIGSETLKHAEDRSLYPRDGTGVKRTHLLMGRAYFEIHEYKNALEHLDIAVVGNEVGAKELWDKTQQALAKEAEPFIKEGEELYRAGKMREARAAFEKALKIHSDNGFARKMTLKVDNVMKAQELEGRAQESMAQGNTSDALESLREAAGLYPENTRLLQQIKEIQEKTAALEATREARQTAADRARREKQDKFDGLFSKARDLEQAEKFGEAQDAYKQALAIFPDNTEVQARLKDMAARVETDNHYQAGRTLFAQRTWLDSIKEFHVVDDKTESGYKDSRRYLALAYLALDKLDEFEKYALLSLEKKPDDVELLYQLADQASHSESSERLQEALARFKQLEAISPGYKDAAARMNRLHWQIYWPEYVVGALLVLGYFTVWLFMKQKPKLMKRLFLKDLERLMGKEDWTGAMTLAPQMRQFELDNRESLGVHANLARAFYEGRQYAKAINEAQLALRLMPRNKELRVLLARAYYASKILSPETLEFYLDLLDVEPDNKVLLSYVGTFCTEKKILNATTMALLRQLAQVQPENDKVRTLLLKGYLKDNDRGAAAMALYRAERERNPENLDVRVIFAEEHLRRGDIDKAIAECEELLNLNLNHPRTHQVMIDAYTKLGKVPELIKVYQAIFESDPRNSFIQAQLLKLTGVQPAPPVGLQPAETAGDAVERSASNRAAQAPTPGRGMQKCPKCGSDVQIGSYFCTCGSPL